MSTPVGYHAGNGVVKEKETLREAAVSNASYALGLRYPRDECNRVLLEHISMYSTTSAFASWRVAECR